MEAIVRLCFIGVIFGILIFILMLGETDAL